MMWMWPWDWQEQRKAAARWRKIAEAPIPEETLRRARQQIANGTRPVIHLRRSEDKK
jgi:hypothetical protein